MPKIALDATVVKTATCPANKIRLDLYDTAVTGFMLEVRQGGHKTYYLRYRNARGTQKQYRIGDAKTLTFAQAKNVAQRLKTRILLGEDPFAQKISTRSVPTLADFVANYFLPYIKQYKRGWKTNLSMLNNHILPVFGALFLDEITLKAVMTLHTTMRDKGYAAVTCNNTVIMVRYMFNLAKKWGFNGAENNPASGITLFEVNNQRERYLTKSELNQLKDAIYLSDNTQLKYIVILLLFTGCRKRELLDAKWEHFNVDLRVWRIPTSKSGKSRYVPLSDAVLKTLEQIPRFDNCPYVLPNPATQRPFNSIYYSWNTARHRAGLPDVRIHDLRHSFASFLVNAGRSLYEVQNILGHSQLSTTQRYAHLSQKTLVDAANAAADAVDWT
ncbi:MAG TPA: integrase [Methylococcaceae bacterium]|nr:integrase [Methylococcaceae bacterium]